MDGCPDLSVVGIILLCPIADQYLRHSICTLQGKRRGSGDRTWQSCSDLLCRAASWWRSARFDQVVTMLPWNAHPLIVDLGTVAGCFLGVAWGLLATAAQKTLRSAAVALVTIGGSTCRGDHGLLLA